MDRCGPAAEKMGLPDRHGGAPQADRWCLEKAVRPRSSASPNNAHTGLWAASETVVWPRVE